jgi:hypothetical protein
VVREKLEKTIGRFFGLSAGNVKKTIENDSGLYSVLVVSCLNLSWNMTVSKLDLIEILLKRFGGRLPERGLGQEIHQGVAVDKIGLGPFELKSDYIYEDIRNLSVMDSRIQGAAFRER